MPNASEKHPRRCQRFPLYRNLAPAGRRRALRAQKKRPEGRFFSNTGSRRINGPSQTFNRVD